MYTFAYTSYRYTWYVRLAGTHSLQVTIKTNLLAELKHQAPNEASTAQTARLET